MPHVIRRRTVFPSGIMEEIRGERLLETTRQDRLKEIAPVTVVLTSCNRFDLLERTLSTFSAHNDYPIARFILVEDSGNDAVRDIAARFPDLAIEVVLNSPSLGQFKSIDKAYRMVDTDFIFHCEDDWEFSQPGLICKSVALMEADARIALVWPRSDEGAPRWMKKHSYQELNGVMMRPIDPKAHHVWGNFTFNPGLRRLSHYKMMPGGYAAMGETRTSIFLKRRGYRAVILANGGVRHIGGEGRSTGSPVATIAKPTKTPKVFARISRARVSLRRRLSHLGWKLSLMLRSSEESQ